MKKKCSAMMLAFCLCGIAMAQENEPVVSLQEQPGVRSVLSFGAKGDGKTDDTQAFQKALNTVGKEGGGIVLAPRGDFLIRGRLDVPPHVTLEGVFRAPTARSQMQGTTLLAVDGRGNADGEPFIMLHDNSTLKGLAVFYPEQKSNDLQPYPWCVRGQGDNCSIVDVLLVNPWQAVDFGTFPCGRHMIRNLYAQALTKGVFVDKCFDVGRIENVHLWPFWEIGGACRDVTAKEANAFIFGRTDWEFVSGCFCIGYKVGFHFTSFADGPGNVVLNNSGSDVGPCAVLVENTQGHAGIAWTNGQFMAGIDVRETNTGPIKFNNCGFWAGAEFVTTSHALLKGKGAVTFNECHFTNWDHKGDGSPAIDADSEALTVNACDFMDEGKAQIRLGKNLKAGIISSNRMRGGIRIENQSPGKVETGLNVGM